MTNNATKSRAENRYLHLSSTDAALLLQHSVHNCKNVHVQ